MTVLRTVSVSYAIADGTTHTSRVLLEEGDTTEADIPRMLAVTHYADAERAGDITVHQVQDLKEGRND